MSFRNLLVALLLLLIYSPLSHGGEIPTRESLQKYRLPESPELADEAVVELGRMLFFDRRLSGDGTMSCATCHIPGMDGFADGRAFSAAYPTNAHFRNTPTAVNAVMRRFLTWDGRVSSASEQALGPIGSPFEMNIHLDLLVEKLRIEPIYKEPFQKAFSREPTKELIAEAIAAFEALLISAPAPFDLYLDGDDDALSENAKLGMEIFFTKGKCVECHDGSQLGGDRFESLGLQPNPEVTENPMRVVSLRYHAKVMGYPLATGNEDDHGRYFVTGEEKDKGKFLVPTLRQLKLTSPYAHDGRFKTLAEIVDFIDQGGGKANHRSEKLHPLELSDKEKTALIEFLLSLTGPDPKIKAPRSLF